MLKLLAWEYGVKVWMWNKFGWWEFVMPLVPAVLLSAWCLIGAWRESRKMRRFYVQG